MSHKRQLRGSILSNSNIYQYNWVHCDDFSDFGARYDQDNKGELISGIPITVAPLTWSFVGYNETCTKFIPALHLVCVHQEIDNDSWRGIGAINKLPTHNNTI